MKNNDYELNKYKDRTFSVETEIIPGNISRGTALILGSFKHVAWGELKCGAATNYHLFNLIIEDNKVTECRINTAGHWEGKDGKIRTQGNKDEVEKTFIALQQNVIESEKLAEVKQGQKDKLSEMAEIKNKRGAEIRAKREELKEVFQKLSEGKSISEQLADRDLQQLAAQLNLFSLLYPERIKR
jgi:hypothetical protein